MAITGTRHAESVAGSGAASIVATCQKMEESCGIHRRKWSRVVAVTATRQGVEACWLKFDWSVWRRGVVSYPFEKSPESASRKSPDEVFLQSKLGMRFGSRESPDGVFLQPESGTRPSSCRGPGGEIGRAHV